MRLRSAFQFFISLFVAGQSRAQTLRDLSVRDAFLVAPSVALPSFALPADHRVYGAQAAAWFDDLAGTLHLNLGLSAASPLPALGLGGTVAATAMYLGPACTGCSAWLAGRIEAQRRLFGPTSVQVSVGRGLRLERRATSTSAAVLVAFDLTRPSISASVFPGLASAGMSTDEQRSQAIRPILGGAIQGNYRSFSLRLSVQLVLPGAVPPITGVDVLRRD
jgi:hypothetical protein